MSRYRATMHTVSISQFRRRLAHWVGCVRFGDDFIRIMRKGMDPVFLISQADFELMEECRRDIDTGPWDPEFNVRHGGVVSGLHELEAKEKREADWEALPEDEKARRNAAWLRWKNG